MNKNFEARTKKKEFNKFHEVELPFLFLWQSSVKNKIAKGKRESNINQAKFCRLYKPYINPFDGEKSLNLQLLGKERMLTLALTVYNLHIIFHDLPND